MLILSTQASKKLKLVLATLACAGAVVFLLNFALLSLAIWTEKHTDAYPFRTEDWLRYLLPTMFEGRGDNRILLIGPSEAREDLLYEYFDHDLRGSRTFQGALSLGTFDDALLALSYIELAYGPGAIPSTIVVGITPRFVANIPPNVSPFVRGLNLYSPYYRVTESSDGSHLVPKTFVEGLIGRYQFFQKYNIRYRSGVANLMRTVLQSEFELNRGKQNIIAYALNFWIFHHTSPYKYRNLAPYSSEELVAWLNDPSSFWFKAHAWAPKQDESLIREQFSRLITIANRWGSRLYIINLPEHPLNRQGYKAGYYEAYMNIVTESLKDVPFLNLRNLLDAEEFFDLGHATMSGAMRVSRRITELIRDHNGVAP